MKQVILVTGAMGQLGGTTVRRILKSHPDADVYVLVRGAASWAARARLGTVGRVEAVEGDVALPYCGLQTAMQLVLSRRITHVLHVAADTSTAQSWDSAFAANTIGTRNVLRLAGRLTRLERLVHAGSAYAAGCRSGVIPETAPENFGFVNAYERSEYAAELEIRATDLPWTIARCGILACDDETGAISRLGPLHRGLSLIHAGVVEALPGTPDTPLDLITADYASNALEDLLLSRDARGETVHLCAGSAAATIEDVLTTAFRVWSRSPAWRSLGIELPSFMSLADYHAHEYRVELCEDIGKARAIEALRYFVPQLAFPKQFDTRRADEILGYGAEPVSAYWRRAVGHMPIGLSRGEDSARNQSALRGSIQLVS